MKYKLTQQQFKNLEEAVKFWLKVPRETVTTDLTTWRTPSRRCEINTTTKPTCGSPACFGGWLPYSPYFAELGVTPYSKSEAQPVIRTNRIFLAYEGKSLARHLFGEFELFASKNYWDKDYHFIKELGANYSDWGLVLMRLAYVLENAELITDPV